MNDVNELLKLRQEKFIETRTKIASEVDTFFLNVDKIDADLMTGAPPIEGSTAKEVLPELWVVPFKHEKYLKELSILEGYILFVEDIADKLNTEALEILKCQSV